MAYCIRVDFQDNNPDLTSDFLLSFFLACSSAVLESEAP